MIKTYFQNRITGAEFAALLEKRESFVLENVGDLDGAIDICKNTLAAQAMTWRIDDSRRSWPDDVSLWLPWPLQLVRAAWTIGKDLLHRSAAPNSDVVLVKRPQALYVRFRSAQSRAGRPQSSVG